jgi:hypothetical protein
MTAGRAEAYDRHTGRYWPELSEAFVSFAAVRPGMRVLDVSRDLLGEALALLLHGIAARATAAPLTPNRG